MKEEWLQPYIQVVGGYEIKLPGNNSCSKSLKVALGFAFKNTRAEYQPVLYAISIANYTSQGSRMNNEAYTAFPVEREILLSEG